MKIFKLKFIDFKNKTTGFSLVETLVAIFVLSLAITSAMAVAQGSLQASFYARDRIQATFLAQEAIELIKNKRDENGLLGNSWLYEIANWDSYGGDCGSGSSGECGVDVNIFKTPSSCSDLGNCELFRKTENPLQGVFAVCPFGDECAEQTGDGGDYEQTGVVRKINMKKINNNEAEITVTVTWASGSREVQITEHILNWHPFSNIE